MPKRRHEGESDEQSTAGDLLEYMKGPSPDAAVVRRMGFGAIADMMPLSAEQRELLGGLVELSRRPDERKEEVDMLAGRMIFGACCPDQALRTRVDELCSNMGEVPEEFAKTGK